MKENRREKEVAAAAAAAAAAAVIDAMGDGLALITMDGKMVAINPTFERMSGYEKDELIGKDVAMLIQKIVKPEDIERIMGVLGATLEGKVPSPSPFTIFRKDGREVPATFTASFIKDVEGKPTHIVATLKDITELKRLQEKEKEVAADREKAAVIDAMPDAMVVVGVDGIITSVNPAFTEKFGYKPEEVVGASAAGFLPKTMSEEAMGKAMGVMKSVFEEGVTGTVEISIKAKDGREIPISGAFSPIKDAKGNITSMIATMRDITELKRAEEERTASLKKAADVIEAMGDALILANMDGKIVSINPAFEKLTGYDKSELIEKEAIEFIPKWFKGEDLENMMNAFGTAFEGKVPAPSPVSVTTKGGEVVSATFTVSFIKDAEGKPTAIIATIKDITELKKAQDELQKKVSDLEDFSRIAVGRELKMKRMEEELTVLKNKLKDKEERK